MKRRLRKKKRVGEFTEYGFPVWFKFPATLSVAERNSLLDDWIRLAIEANGLLFGGGGANDVWEGFITLNKRGSTTENHRRLVEDWLKGDTRVSEYKVGPRTDAWYGDHDSWFAETGEAKIA